MKKTYDNNNYYEEPINGDYYEDPADGEYYEDSETGDYYEDVADDEYYEETEPGEYYEDTEGGDYYEESETAEYYEDPADGDYYEDSADAEYYEEPVDGEYYEESEYGEYYADSEPTAYYPEDENTGYYADSEDDMTYYEAPKGADNPSPSPQKTLWQKFQDMETSDRIMLYLGAAVLLLAIAAGGLFIRIRIARAQVAKLETVGTQLKGMDTIGRDGLLAVADAALAKLAAAEMVQQEEEEPTEEPQPEYEENEYSKSVTVTLKMVSVQRDLKIKFVNKSTDKLIANTPFSLTVTTAENGKEVWSDDDMDGIIYKKNIAPGEYKVAVNSLEGSAYEGYILPGDIQTAEVKKDIAYEKIDVSDEVKTEAQVDVAHEEQKKEELEVESTLTDTVKWVPSTVVEGTYTEVKKKNIEAPIPEEAETVKPSVSPGDVVMSQENSSAGSGALEKTVYIGNPVSVKMKVADMPTGAVLKAKSSDKNVATTSVSGQTVTVSGVKEGTATITVKCKKDDAEIANAEWTIFVVQDPKNDTFSLLKDKKGNQLYVQEGDNYREAAYADYYRDGVKLYKRGLAKYTGWQTIDGNLYFFTEAYEKVTGEQIIQGAKYNFASDGSLVAGSGTLGIDVSKHNGDINWNAVKNSGISYVIIRCGYRGYTEGVLVEDPKFRQNIKGATAAGLKVGVYFFSQAIDEVEAVAEASFVLDAVKGYKISYPIFLDVESSGAPGNRGRADGLDLATRTAVCKAFCATIRSGGYTAGIYANKTWLTSKIDPGQLGAYKIWLAQYAAQPTYAGRFDMWQYQSSGQVSGISGRVDMNISYLGY